MKSDLFLTIAFVFFTVCFGAIIEANNEPISVLYTVRSKDKPIKSIFSPSCDDVHFVDNYTAQLVGRREEYNRIVSLGLEIISQEKGRALYDAPPAGYHTPEEFLSEFKGLQTKYPTRAQLIDLTATYGTPSTIEGRHIYALKISDNVATDEVEPNVLLVSAHHCRELISPEIALNTSRHLLDNYDLDNSIRSIVNSKQLYVIWDQNPDGAAYVWSRDNMWRKNRRPNSNGSYGVDLNRNYPVGWDFSCGGSIIPDSETYRGPYAGSESEIQTMLAFHNDRRFERVVDYHSYSREVRTIYGDCAALPSIIDNYFIETAQFIAKQMNYDQVRSCCMGGNVHSSYHSLGALSYLFETGTSFQPSQSQMEAELVRVLPGTLAFLNLVTPVSGIVTDADGKAVEANITLDKATFNLGEIKRSNPKNGLYHIWIPTGLWNVTFTAQGYQSKSLEIEVTARGVVRNVSL